MSTFHYSVIGDRQNKFITVEQVGLATRIEADELIAAVKLKMDVIWPEHDALAEMHMDAAEKAAEAKAIAQTSLSVIELRERCVMAQLRACPEVDARTIITEAEIMVQYILNGAEKE